MESAYYIIKNKKEVRRLIEACSATGYASYDYESTGLRLYDNSFHPTILSVCYQPGISIVLPLNHHESPFRDKSKGGDGTWKKLLRKFGRKVIENRKITKIAWNIQFDERINRLYGIYSQGVTLDAMLMKYLLNEEKPHGLKEMVSRYLPDFAKYQNENDIDKLPWDKKPLQGLSKYGGLDADLTFRLAMFLEKKLIDGGFYPLYRNLIMMATKVLMRATERGLVLDREMNAQLEVKYIKLIQESKEKIMTIKKVRKFERWLIDSRKEKYIDSIEAEIDKIIQKGKGLKKSQTTERNRLLKQIETRKDKIARITAGEFTTNKERDILAPINFGSPQQMSQLLYLSPKGLKFPIIEYTKDKQNKPTNNPSTAEDVIKQLKPYDKAGFIDALLELRGHEHSLSTFIVGWKERVQDDGKLHPSFLVHGTTSGRLSSKDPNGQQIPKMEVNPDIKPQLLPEPGRLFFNYDYSQAELRILAHLAGETTMLEWFRDGKDIHLASACKKYNEDYNEILKIYENENHPEYKKWKIRRKQAKTINFGVVYEQTAMKLAEGLSDREKGIEVTMGEAQEFLDDFFRLFPKIKKYVKRQHSKMEKDGYVVSLFGRKRRCPDVFGDNYQKYLESLRQSTNFPCQSAASDMALFASILTWEEIRKGVLPDMPEVNTVHDSVYRLAWPKDITPYSVYKIWDICRNPKTKEYFGFRVTDVDMSMDFSIGRHIGEELPYIPGYDYNKMLLPNFRKEEYIEEHKKYRDISIKDYPKLFPEYFKKHGNN